MNPIVWILGRRSGTSSMAKALYDQGFPLTGPLNTKPYAAQPEGHYENQDILNIHDALFAAHNFKPWSCGILPFRPMPALNEWLKAHPEPLLLKVPSIAQAWPVWASMTTRPVYLMRCTRSKREQIDSMVRRYNLDEHTAAGIIELYEGSYDWMERHYGAAARLPLTDGRRVETAMEFLQRWGLRAREAA